MAKQNENTTGGTITIQYYRSSIGYSKKQKDIVKSLGITKLNQTVSRPDTPSMRGIVAKVPHLLAIVDRPAAPAWATVPEYTVRPPEVLPVEQAEAAVESSSGEERVVAEGEKAQSAAEEAEPSE